MKIKNKSGNKRSSLLFGFVFGGQIQEDPLRSDRIFRILTIKILVQNRLIKVPHEILIYHWSAQIEELV